MNMRKHGELLGAVIALPFTATRALANLAVTAYRNHKANGRARKADAERCLTVLENLLGDTRA